MKNKNIIKLLILVIILLIISFTAFYITKKRSAEIASNKPRTQIFELNETNANKYELIFESEDVMKNETVSADNAEVNETGEVKKATTAFYPDVAFNKKERKKTVMLSLLLIVLMGGMGLTIILGGIQNGGGSMSFISGARS